MGLRFHKSIKILPGVRLNINKGSVSVTAGVKGAHYTLSSKGTGTASLGIPGTGVSYQKKMNLFKLFSGDKKAKKTSNEETKVVENKSAVTVAESDLIEAAKSYQEYIASITSLHKECSPTINWQNVADFAIPENSSAEDILKYQNNIADAKKILAQDIDSYEIMMERHSPFKELAGYGSAFEFGTDDPERMECEFTVNFDDVVPDYYFKQTTKGIVQTPLAKTAYNELKQDYVCSCAIKIAREVFALLPVNEVLVHATDNILDKATGNGKEIAILSVLFKREMFKNINYDLIDPSDFVDRFEKHDGFRKTTGYKEITRLA